MIYSSPYAPANLPLALAPQGGLTTLAIASAVAVGANLIDVQEGKRSLGQAVLNGVAKGTMATLILQVTTRNTKLQTALTIAALLGAGYLVDSAMRKNACPTTVQSGQVSE